ncbi:MAG: ABC transporter ATP-binding protein [Planctomycetes bacterium]|nr:ABC transporter ATP-binding protein [Planctomycetota bacterium]
MPPHPSEPTIVARGLARAFGARTALHPTDLALGPGGVIGLLGPNGSGKSTLLRMLVGLVRPDAGSAVVAGVPLAGDGTAIRRRATYAPGELALYGELSGRDHLGWLLRGRERAARSRAIALAETLGLPLSARVRSYSHGMKRQLLFSAALAPAVPVRILDEPTEGLDPTKRGEVLDLVADDARAGRTILLSSHHLGEVDRACDRLVFLAAGRKIADETAASVARRARRLVRVAYATEADLLLAEREVGRLAGASPRREAGRLSVLLEDDDPRAFLAALSDLRVLPAPQSVEYGQISLQELYRELYGVEGC